MKDITSSIQTMQSHLQNGASSYLAKRYASLSTLAQQNLFGELEQVVIVDTETTGISFQKDELTQIAAARMAQGKVIERFSTFVNPGKPIPEDIIHLTHITDEDTAHAPTPGEAIQELARFVRDTPLVAHNAVFDRFFITNHPQGYPLLENLWFDSLELSRICLPFMKSHRLIDLAKAFEIPLSTHRADADVETTCYLYRILLAAIHEMPETLKELLARLTDELNWPTAHIFKQFELTVSDDTKKTSTLTLLRRLREARVKDDSQRQGRQKQDAAELIDLRFPEKKEIAQAFSENGVLGLIYDDYEPRSEQRQMAVLANSSFEHSVNVAIEAGTGVGKSLGYLLPLSLIAQRNNICVGVSTKTNALLDQLHYQELPRLSKALVQAKMIDSELHFAALKGFTHYLCLYKLYRLLEKGAEFRNVGKEKLNNAPALATILSFVEQARFEDIDMLKTDWRLVSRASVTCGSRECLKNRCPFFGNKCFVLGARKKAENADVVLTNHSLMLCDMAVDKGLLPNILYWAVDEAHNIESEARKTFSVSVESEEMLSLAHRLNSNDVSVNPLARLRQKVAKPTLFEAQTLTFALLEKLQSAIADYPGAVEGYCKSVKGLLFFTQGGRNQAYETVDVWLNEDIRASNTFNDVAKKAEALSALLKKAVKASQALVAVLDENAEHTDIQREISLLTFNLLEQAESLDKVFAQQTEDYVYAATLNKKKDRFKDTFEAFPLELGPSLNEKLFNETNGVLFCSATLSVDGDFSSFEKALGLNTSEFSACNYQELRSSFDYDRNMTIYVAQDIPEAGSSGYLKALQGFLADLHLAQHGSMLTLFTNKREMEECFDAVRPILADKELRLVCQKWGVSVKGLRDDFISDKTLSLFALKSFWEGFDAPGDTLRGVVIPKLPFVKPSDPLSLERERKDPQAWYHYVLPAAVLEMKQAAGRLIRKADDKGVLVLADSRLVRKRYGRVFLNSMPSRTIKVMKMADIVDEISRLNGR